MANSGEPDSNGSQFFLVYKNSDLPASYTPFGTISQRSQHHPEGGAGGQYELRRHR